MTENRIVYLDWLRFIACFMVMLTHSVEPYYLGGDGTYIATASDGLMCSIINAAVRSCVPLFLIASGTLLFPLRTGVRAFVKRRFVRIVIPLAIWVLLYCIVPLPGTSWADQNIGGNFLNTVFNFPGPGGHLWFVYMILGVYIGMIVFSPFVEKLSRRGEEIFLVAWFVTSLVPPVRKVASVLTGSTELWGEANWNEFGTLYYISGFIGYIILAHYIREYHSGIPCRKALAIALPLWLAGFAISAGFFWGTMPKVFPYNGPLDTAIFMEGCWQFNSTGVVMMATGLFLLISRIKCSGRFYRKIVLPVSKAGYGMYLMHMFYLLLFLGLVQSLGMAMLPTVFLTAILTYIASAITSIAIQHIPGGKYIVG